MLYFYGDLNNTWLIEINTISVITFKYRKSLTTRLFMVLFLKNIISGYHYDHLSSGYDCILILKLMLRVNYIAMSHKKIRL